VLLKTDCAAMEIREVLVATPGSAKQRFRPTRWHPRRAGTGRAPKASRCWRGHSSSASVFTRFFRATKAKRHFRQVTAMKMNFISTTGIVTLLAVAAFTLDPLPIHAAPKKKFEDCSSV
jgi:hypothetical protein